MLAVARVVRALAVVRRPVRDPAGATPWHILHVGWTGWHWLDGPATAASDLAHSRRRRGRRLRGSYRTSVGGLFPFLGHSAVHGRHGVAGVRVTDRSCASDLRVAHGRRRCDAGRVVP